MNVHQICIGLMVRALPRRSLPRCRKRRKEVDERVDRIVGMAMARGGRSAFLQRLTDSIGGRVTGSPSPERPRICCSARSVEAGFEDAHFEEYALRVALAAWTSGRARRQPRARALAVGSYGWVPGTKGEVTASLVDSGRTTEHRPSRLQRPGSRCGGHRRAPRQWRELPAQVMRAALARALARAGPRPC